MYKVHATSASKTLMKTEWGGRKKTQMARICEGRRKKNGDLLFLQEEEKLWVQSRDFFISHRLKYVSEDRTASCLFPLFLYLYFLSLQVYSERKSLKV